MPIPNIRKYVKRLAIFVVILTVITVGIAITANYYLKDYGITYASFNYDFPNELTINKLKVDNEDFLLTAEYAHVSLRLKRLLNGELSGEYLEANNLWVELRPGDPNDTSVFELSDLMPMQADRLEGSNIHYLDKEGLDSTFVELPTFFASNFVLDNGIFTDSIISKNGTLILSFPDTTESDDTTALMADLMYLNANVMVLENAHIQFNYPDETFDAKHVEASLNGFGTNNPIDFKLNHLSMVYQDSIELSSNGKELSITQKGDLAMQQFEFKTPLLKMRVHNAGATAKERYYATLNKSHINSNVVRMFVDDFPVKENTDILLDGEIAWDNDSIIFNQFKVVLDKRTEGILNGFAIYGDTLEQTNIDVVTFQSSLFELQRLFALDQIDGQKDVNIATQLFITGNLSALNIKGLAQLNKNQIAVDLLYASRMNKGSFLQTNISSSKLNPHQIITSTPEGLAISNVTLRANTTVDSNFNAKQLLANFECSELVYNDYTLTNFKSNASINAGLTRLTAQANEQNFVLNISTRNDVLTSDSIHFTGLLDINIPTLSNLSKTAGNTHSPINGYVKSNDEEFAFQLNLDSLIFTSDSLENRYVDLISFQYNSDTTYGILIDLNVNDEDVFWFEGDPQTFEWMGAQEIDTTNYPYFKAELHLNLDSSLFSILVGDSGSINITDLKVETTENDVSLSMIAPQIVYQEYNITNTQANFSTNFKTYQGNLTIDSLKNPYANLDDVKIKIASTQENITQSEFYVMLTDFDESVDFSILYLDSGNTNIIKFEDGKTIKLGEQNWVVTQNQGATFNSDWDLVKSHFTATYDSQYVAFSTHSKIIDFDISHFKVGPLYTVITGDSIVKGILNLQSEYNVQEESMVWKGRMNNIEVDTILVGDFSTSGLVTNSHFESHGEFIHQNSQLFLDLEMKKSNPLQYKLDLQNFDLTSLNPLYEQWGFDGEIDGSLSGKLEGSIDEEIEAEGYIQFNKVKAQLDEYGVFLGIENSRIEIDNDDLAFKDFTIKDKEGAPLKVNGKIPLSENRALNLTIKSNHFKVIDQPDKNKKYWGKLDASTNLSITGKYDNLKIRGFLKTLKSSNIGYRYHSEVTVNKMDEEIEFTSFSDTLQQVKKVKRRKKHAKIDWDVHVDFGKTKLYVLLSEVSNDFVRMTADGNLKLKTGKGQMPKVFGELKGNNGSIFYDAPMVSDLNLKIEYVSVKFRGDAKNPVMSFKGTEIFRVSTNEISEQSGKNGKMVPVQVIALVDESPIDEFEIKFDLKSDDGEMGAYLNSLPANTRETYAMNLLVFGAFSQSGQEANTAMRAVVSKLNEITRRNIKSADLAFYVDTQENVNESNMSGVNSIGYDFSKEFFDDKVKVSVGGEVVLETYAADGRKQFNPFGNVEINYRLKEDPDITLFASKKDSYLGPIDGQVDKYSVGISFTRWFKNLFNKSKKKRE